MTLLSISQSISLRVLHQTITSAAQSADPLVLQLVEAINEEGQELSSKYTWQSLTKEATFNTLAAESQGTITTIAGTDFAFIINETIWNRSQRRPVFGPRSEAEWQQLKAQQMQGPWNQWRLRGNQILFIPAPAAGQSIYFEWMTKNWCTDTTGVTGKTAMTVDTDIGVLDERLLTLGGLWRWKQMNKLDYAEDRTKYDEAIDNAMNRDGANPILNMAGTYPDIFPSVLVPSGSWPV